MRRPFLKSLLATPLLLSGFDCVRAQSPGAQQAPSQAAPYQMVNIPADRNTVRLFISFDCSYSMDSFETFTQWGKTLPRSIRFEIDQVASAPENLSFAVIWNAVKKVATPKEQYAFAQYFFAYVKSQKVAPTDPSFYAKLFKENKIPNLALAVKATTKADLLAQIKRTEQYQLTNTPSLGIGGRYSVSPKDTNGDYGLFMELANGLVSQMLG